MGFVHFELVLYGTTPHAVELLPHRPQWDTSCVIERSCKETIGVDVKSNYNGVINLEWRGGPGIEFVDDGSTRPVFSETVQVVSEVTKPYTKTVMLREVST
ncbi:TPA_asm: hypothetical protein G1X19_07915 [Salmonella enterica subsp. enterica serovar Typhimurium str. SL1344]|uniref:Uncharacterized protein n=1 Tax=Salmonella typhimurium (strain SL1344) TaxID=216597 RepID=A0A718VXH1_SALTS|nr:hypothetical protein [Salmonella enterica subsp. enterica serovar Typhimurium str. SL1344]